jgi:hypothetical protein
LSPDVKQLKTINQLFYRCLTKQAHENQTENGVFACNNLLSFDYKSLEIEYNTQNSILMYMISIC